MNKNEAVAYIKHILPDSEIMYSGNTKTMYVWGSYGYRSDLDFLGIGSRFKCMWSGTKPYLRGFVRK